MFAASAQPNQNTQLLTVTIMFSGRRQVQGLSQANSPTSSPTCWLEPSVSCVALKQGPNLRWVSTAPSRCWGSTLCWASTVMTCVWGTSSGILFLTLFKPSISQLYNRELRKLSGMCWTSTLFNLCWVSTAPSFYNDIRTKLRLDTNKSFNLSKLVFFAVFFFSIQPKAQRLPSNMASF